MFRQLRHVLQKRYVRRTNGVAEQRLVPNGTNVEFVVDVSLAQVSSAGGDGERTVHVHGKTAANGQRKVGEERASRFTGRVLPLVRSMPRTNRDRREGV